MTKSIPRARTLRRITNADIHKNRDGVRETILATLERRETV
ncbi:hypothetical protein [Methylobacterium sp. J-088]|nr:hypothetical protein [Methylobacterium sp. J-088]